MVIKVLQQTLSKNAKQFSVKTRKSKTSKNRKSNWITKLGNTDWQVMLHTDMSFKVCWLCKKFTFILNYGATMEDFVNNAIFCFVFT